MFSHRNRNHIADNSECEQQKEDFCQLQQLKFAEFEAIIQQSDTQDLKTLYTLGTAWALWIQAHKSDMNAIAQLAQVKALMKQVVKLDESYEAISRAFS